MKYVTYAQGRLTGAFIQDLVPEHEQCHIEVTDGEIENWILYQPNAGATGIELSPIIITVEPVPQTCTMRQGRLALHRAGKLSMIDAVIASLPSPQREEAEIEWEYGLKLERAWPTLQLLGTASGLTDEEMDDLFRLAVTL